MTGDELKAVERRAAKANELLHTIQIRRNTISEIDTFGGERAYMMRRTSSDSWHAPTGLTGQDLGRIKKFIIEMLNDDIARAEKEFTAL